MTATQRKAHTTTYPKLLVLKAEEVQPTLAEAFERWRGLGEYPQDCGLFLFVGGTLPYQNEVSGELVNPLESWETLSIVVVKGDKKKSWLILRIPA